MERFARNSEPLCSVSNPEKVGDCLSFEEKKKRFQEDFCPTAGLSDSQKKRQRKLRQVRRFRDEACRKLLEKDEELEASRAENDETREICKEKIEQQQAVVKKVKETCEHQQLDINRLRENNRSLKFQLEERSRIGRQLCSQSVSRFLQNAESGQPFDESLTRGAPDPDC